ncbi:beta-propeller domain-containing protein [Candidatus Peregrinibacteria bacterium]|nr:beta-propeller domain-containing protein [Candidatus Peregrinibacteria bacterium]
MKKQIKEPLKNYLPTANCKLWLRRAYRSSPYRYLIRLRRGCALLAQSLQFSLRNIVFQRFLSFAVISTAVISVLFFLPADLSAQKSAQAFSDVPLKHPFAKTIDVLKQKGFVKGYPDGTFAPDATVSRAEFITMIMASAGENLSGENCFKDVKNEWFAPFVCSAKKKGIVSGYSDGNFGPANNINFAEASAVLAKAYKLNPLKPAKGEPWYKPIVKKLEAKKAIPVSIDYLDKKLSRAETGEIILRLKEKIKNRPTKTFVSLSSDFPQIGSCGELREKLSIDNYVHSFGEVEKMMLMEMAVPAATTGAEADYSSTNVQVEGVDEADVIKNDGEFIYMANGDQIKIIKAFPPEKLEESAKIEFADKNFTPSEIYIDKNKLIVIGSSSAFDEAKGHYSTKTKVYIFDVSDKQNLKEERSIEIEGWMLSSRKIGSNLYLVANYSPVYGVESLKTDAEVLEILPHFKDSADGQNKILAGCSDIKFVPEYDRVNFMTVASINVENPTSQIQKEVVMGGGDTVYASTGGLYVAARRYRYPLIGTFKIWGGQQSNFEQKTEIFRFNLENGAVKFATKGEVKGTLLNQFSMDEAGGAFRIATTAGEVWNKQNPSKNHLFILDKNDLGKVLGKIEDIAPGEKIYSMRFMGPRAYMVTFKKVDPFFVIDVSDDANPKILGELKIPGFSDYLHPFDENHIIGFGKEAVDPQEIDKAGLGGRGFDFAWYQGMKIALFDVTDTANPKMLFKEIIGDRGTNSELLYNHKVLLYDKARNLFAFPVTVAEIKDKMSGQYTGKEYGETIFQGAYVYNLDLQNGFQLKGKITNYDNSDWYGDTNAIKRVIYIGDYLYGIAYGKIKAVSRDAMEEKAVLKLDDNLIKFYK